MARRLKPLVQAEVEKRRLEGAHPKSERGKTREIVARRVGLSYELLRQGEYVLDSLEQQREQRDRSLQASEAEPALQARVAELETIVDRMESTDRKRQLAISAAYRSARALIEGHAGDATAAEPAPGPGHVVRIPTAVKPETDNGFGARW